MAAKQVVDPECLNAFIDHLDNLHTEPRGHRGKPGRAVGLYLSEWESGYERERDILFDLLSVADADTVYQFLEGHGFDSFSFFPAEEQEEQLEEKADEVQPEEQADAVDEEQAEEQPEEPDEEPGKSDAEATEEELEQEPVEEAAGCVIA